MTDEHDASVGNTPALRKPRRTGQPHFGVIRGIKLKGWASRNSAGYRGVVATQYGIKAVAQGKLGVGMIGGALGLGDTSVEGRIQTGLTVVGFIPGAGTGAAAASLGVDAYKIYKAQSACVASGKYD